MRRRNGLFMRGDHPRASRTTRLQAPEITYVDDALTTWLPAVRRRISRDSLKATLMPASSSAGRPFFTKDFTRIRELVAYDSTALYSEDIRI